MATGTATSYPVLYTTSGSISGTRYKNAIGKGADTSSGDTSKLYLKLNGTWTECQLYKKTNGSWSLVSDPSTELSTTANYVKGN